MPVFYMENIDIAIQVLAASKGQNMSDAKEFFLQQAEENLKDDADTTLYAENMVANLKEILEHATVELGKSVELEKSKLFNILLFSQNSPGGSLADYCGLCVLRALDGLDSLGEERGTSYKIEIPVSYLHDCGWFKKNVEEYAIYPELILSEYGLL